MKHYLHKFANQAAYTTAKSGQDFYLPAVSLIESGMSVIYDSLPVVPEGFVDFGLSSGTLWAQYNLGVDPTDLDSPEDWYGNYYAWGETETKENYDWEHYEHSYNGKLFETNLIKYCNNSDFGYNGFTDNLSVLTDEDDASKQINSNWSMPTEFQFNELFENTEKNWETDYQGIEGLNGMKCTKAIITQQAFKNVSLYSEIFEGELDDEIWNEIKIFTLEGINEQLSGQDIRTMMFKDAEYTIPAIYGTDYGFVVKQVDSSTSIFLPAAGVKHEGETQMQMIGITGSMWTKNLDINGQCISAKEAIYYLYNETEPPRLIFGVTHNQRDYGLSIRPVITPAS